MQLVKNVGEGVHQNFAKSCKKANSLQKGDIFASKQEIWVGEWDHPYAPFMSVPV